MSEKLEIKKVWPNGTYSRYTFGLVLKLFVQLTTKYEVKADTPRATCTKFLEAFVCSLSSFTVVFRLAQLRRTFSKIVPTALWHEVLRKLQMICLYVSLVGQMF